MNVTLQFSVADEFFRAGYYALQREGLSERDREQALNHLETAKQTFQLCLDSGSPDLNARLTSSIEGRIAKIRELLVGDQVNRLALDEEKEE